MDQRYNFKPRTSSWTAVIASWMNSLQEVTSTARLYNESKFMVILINRIYEYEKKKVPDFQNSEDLIDKFTKEYLEENQVEKHFTLKNGQDRFIIYGLLMYTSCIRCQFQDVLSKNCRYMKGTTQAALQKFFEDIMRLGEGNVTKGNILNAIKTSLGLANSQRRRSQSPMPSLNCLREFFYSLTLQDRLNYIKENRRLKCLLEKEINEKNEFIVKYNLLEKELKRKEILLNEKTKENVTLREVLNQPTEVREHRECKALLADNQKLCSEIKETKLEIEQLYEKLDKSVKENLALNNMFKDQELSLECHQKQCEAYNEKLISMQEENHGLKCEIKELREIVERHEEQLRPIDVQNISTHIDEDSLGKTKLTEMLLNAIDRKRGSN